MNLLGNSISFSIEIPGALPFTSELVQSLLNVHWFQTFSWKKGRKGNLIEGKFGPHYSGVCWGICLKVMTSLVSFLVHLHLLIKDCVLLFAMSGVSQKQGAWTTYITQIWISGDRAQVSIHIFISIFQVAFAS